MDKLRTLELFIATCDGGSFAAAAKTCGTDPSTVSKAINRLEAQLEVTLFQRSTRQLQVTNAGRQYEHTARHVIRDISSCENELKHKNDLPIGTLKINVAACYGRLYIRPLLTAFCQKYPDIKLELEINDLHIDIIENNIDLALRTGFIKDSRLIGRRLSPMDFFTCASPHYLKKFGTPFAPEDFKQHQWIGFRIKETQQLQPILLPNKTGEYLPFELSRDHITDDGETMEYMCAEGLGVAQLPHFLAKKGLENGSLISLFPYFRPPQHENGVFAIYPKRRYLPTKVSVFIEFITEHLTALGESTHKTWAENWHSIHNFKG